MNHTTEEIIDTLEEIAERAPVLMGSGTGVMVSPDLLRVSADRLKELQRTVLDLETQHRIEICENGYDCAELGRVRSELKKVTPGLEVLEAIDDLVGYARPTMSIAPWLGYANVLSEWMNQFRRSDDNENDM